MSAIARSIKSAKGAASLVAALGSVVAAATAKKGKKSTKTAKKGRAKKKKTNMPMVKNLGGMSSSLAPVSVGVSMRSSKRNEHIITVPFNSITPAGLGTLTATNIVKFLNSTGAGGSSYYDLSPRGASAINSAYQTPFGTPMNLLSNVYNRWRVKRLRVSYIATANTASNGTIFLGVMSENFNTGVFTAQQVADCELMMSTPVWQSAAMDLTPLARLDSEWLYTKEVFTGDAVSGARMNNCCTLVVSSLGVMTAGASAITYGYIRFDGELEFTGLNDDGIINPAVSLSEEKQPQENIPDEQQEASEQQKMIIHGSSEPKLDEMTGKWYIPTRPTTPAKSSTSAKKSS
jgi:hypothetical protein